MQNDSGMSDYPLLALCRCQAVSRMMKTDVVCVVLMEVTKCRDARETVLPVYLLSAIGLSNRMKRNVPSYNSFGGKSPLTAVLQKILSWSNLRL